MSALSIDGVTVEDTFAEAFGMRATRLVITAITPVIQYAWTFFYLRLVEAELGLPGVEVGPAYAAAAAPSVWEPSDPRPELLVVQPDRQEDAEPEEGRTG